ncbi:Hypothetical protein NTJ_01399 [Nesidiocoris tenuis]|uniref:Secreted protein n=1 Tax=Nesidiocoris tenuis TaxID=355587 RepID=A0ABN7A9D6_9HEMI|nr:Hypothetical protein NTJ_01399 [Nesidiocoris tenuis]
MCRRMTVLLFIQSKHDEQRRMKTLRQVFFRGGGSVGAAPTTGAVLSDFSKFSPGAILAASTTSKDCTAVSLTSAACVTKIRGKKL